jgi:putative tricarboxylic transport membrane protein
MRYGELTSLFLLAFSILYSAESLRLGIGSIRNPGPGFMPFFCGCLLGALSIAIFVHTRSTKEGTAGVGRSSKKGFWILGGLLFYALLLERLGFIITTFLFLILSLMSFRPRRWAGILLVSSITVMISYLVFGIWLKVQLPKGILGI